MSAKWIFPVVLLSVFFFASVRVPAQSTDERFEVGGQFSAFRLSSAKVVSTTTFPCVVPPCPVSATIGRGRETDPGFGGRIGFRAGNYVTIEAEVDFFPHDDILQDGRKLEGLFGAKVGKRSKKFGVFGKARPGFLSVSRGDFQPKPNTGCVTIFPPPVGCFDAQRKSGFAFDAGAVVEIYPSSRSIIRFDIGDTIVHFGDRNVAVFLNPPSAYTAVVFRPAETTHNLQAGIGFGFRF